MGGAFIVFVQFLRTESSLRLDVRRMSATALSERAQP